MKKVLLFGLLTVAVGFGCSNDTPSDISVAAGDSARTAILQDGGSVCARPGEGCACGAGAGPMTCFGDPVPQPGGFVCNEGAMYCRGGYWSACETIRTYTILANPAALSAGPTPCNMCNPSCFTSSDEPHAGDLTPGRASGVIYDPSAGGITLPSVVGGTGTLTDTDGDGVPDIADDYPTDMTRWIAGGGFYHTLPFGGPSVIDPLAFDTRVTTADIYFLMDTTGSMGDEIANLQATLTSGTFAGSPGGVVGAIRSIIPGSWFGVGSHDDYPIPTPRSSPVSCYEGYVTPDWVWAYAGCWWTPPSGSTAGMNGLTLCGALLNPSLTSVVASGCFLSQYGNDVDGDLPYIHRLDITSSTASTSASINALPLHYGGDGPEAQTQALYAIATGNGIPFVGASGGCSGGAWGYPCFRAGTIPIVILITDAPFHNGPSGLYAYDASVVNGADASGTVKSWPQVIGALNARNIRIISVISTDYPTDNSVGTALHDAEQLGIATNSIDRGGRPYVETIRTDGSGLGSSIVTAVENLANNTMFDVSARATDNPATAAFDERTFVQSIQAISYPAGRCASKTATTFIQCQPGTNVNFEVTFKNNVVMPTSTAQIFNFSIEVVLDGTTVQTTIPVRIVVPPSVTAYPPMGTFVRDYDATIRCTIPPERPDWGVFDWTASTPPGTSIRFEFRTADTAAALASATPVSFTVPPTVPTQDVGVLLTSGAGNFHPYLRATAVLLSSADRSAAPTLTGFSMQYTCAPAE